MGEVGVLRSKAKRETSLAGGEIWPGPRVEAAWDMGRGLESFILVLWTGKLRL